MRAGKWNFETKSYERYELPPGASMHEVDLNKFISCAECGDDLVFGLGFTSRKIHNSAGLAYAVCESCYGKELEDEHAAYEKGEKT